MPDIDNLVLRFHRAASAANVPYAFIGALAIMAWGQPRATNDVDVLVRLARDQAPSLVAALATEGIETSMHEIEGAILDRSHVSMFDAETSFRFDVKLVESQQEKAEVDEAFELPFHGATIRVVRPEETIAFKLLYGSPLDLQDARSVLVRQDDRLDMQRLRQIAARLRVTAKLDRLLADESDEEE